MRYDTEADGYEEAKAERDAERRYMQQLLAHPDPRDPDHPARDSEDDL